MPAGFIHRLGERILRKRMLYVIVFFIVFVFLWNYYTIFNFIADTATGNSGVYSGGGSRSIRGCVIHPHNKAYTARTASCLPATLIDH